MDSVVVAFISFILLHQIVLVAPQCIEKAGTTQLLGFYSGTKALPGVAKVLSGASPYGELAQYFIAHEAAPPAARAFSNPTATATFTTTPSISPRPLHLPPAALYRLGLFAAHLRHHDRLLLVRHGTPPRRHCGAHEGVPVRED